MACMVNPAKIIHRLRSKTRKDFARFLRWRLHDLAAATFRVPWPLRWPTQRTFRPDSFWIYNQHSEHGQLFRRFTARNLNNRGDEGRLIAFMLNIKQVIAEGVQGEFAELGVWRGNTAAVLAHYARSHGRKVFLFDTFEGFADSDLAGIDRDKKKGFSDTSLKVAASVIGDLEAVELVKGYFPDTVTDAHRNSRYAVVSLDCDLYAPMNAGLEFFYPRMNEGGLFLLHDYSSGVWEGAKRAIDEFCNRTGERPVLMPDKSGSAFIRVRGAR